MHTKDIVFTIASAAHWKALSHPLRLGILRLLAADELTNEELAHSLGVASGKLYFHTKMLLTAGLIEGVGTRQKGPITEKLYRAVAQRYVASPSVAGDTAPLVSAVTTGLALYQNSWQQDPNLTHFGAHSVMTISPERTREFVERLQRLAEDFTQSGPATRGAHTVALTTLLHTIPDLER